MAKLTAEEKAQLDALRAKEEAPDDEPDGDGDDGHVIVLRGSRADAFLSSLLGPSPRPAKKAAAPAARRNGTRPPAETQSDGDGDGDGDDQGDGDQGAEQDAQPPRTNRYFR